MPGQVDEARTPRERLGDERPAAVGASDEVGPGGEGTRTWGTPRLLGVGRSRMAVAAVLLPPTLVVTALADATIATGASHAPRGVVALGWFVTEFGTSGYMFAYSAVVAAAALLALGRGRVRWPAVALRQVVEGSAYFFLAIAASGLAAQAIKHVLGRARPAMSHSADPFVFHPFSLANDLASFPSGHTTSAFAAAVALGLLSPRWRWWLLGCAALIGASRVVVGAHYPSDVVGGAALGSFAATFLAWACARRHWAFRMVDGRPMPKRPDPT